MKRAPHIALILAATIAAGNVSARDGGQWGERSAEVAVWFARQMMPDFPTTSCCGKADAYEADSFEVVDGKVYATITDTREDGPLMRTHIDAGTRIEIPTKKLTQPSNDPNPTGHGLVFIGVMPEGSVVYCWRRPVMS